MAVLPWTDCSADAPTWVWVLENGAVYGISAPSHLVLQNAPGSPCNPSELYHMIPKVVGALAEAGSVVTFTGPVCFYRLAEVMVLTVEQHTQPGLGGDLPAGAAAFDATAGSSAGNAAERGLPASAAGTAVVKSERDGDRGTATGRASRAFRARGDRRVLVQRQLRLQDLQGPCEQQAFSKHLRTHAWSRRLLRWVQMRGDRLLVAEGCVQVWPGALVLQTCQAVSV